MVTLVFFDIVMITTAIVFLYPIIFLLRHSFREFREKNKENILNYSISILLLIFILYSFFQIFNIMRILSDPLLDLYLYIIMFTLTGFWLSVFISSILYKLFGDPQKIKSLDKKMQEDNIRNPIMEDTKRKLFHIIFYLLLWVGIYIMSYQIILFEPRFSQPENYELRVWGYNAENPAEIFYFFRLLARNATFIENPGIAVLFLFIFVIGGFVSITLEAIRYSKVFYFPTNQFIIFLLRKKEINSIASHFYMFLAFSFSSFILPPLLAITVMGVVFIGDAAASQFGMRWGKNKIKINPKKSWIGTIAGAIVSFLVSVFFIGVIYGIITAIVFAIIDIFTEKPINISDNLSVPIVLTAVYIFLNLIGIAYTYPVFLYP